MADRATPRAPAEGLARRILEDLLAEIRAKAPEGAYVTLIAGQALYRSLGFTEPTKGSVMTHQLRD